MSLDLVVLGNLLLDDVVLPDGRTRMAEPGGAVLYAALGARLWGLRVGIVSVRGDDYPAAALDLLARRGVALDGVRPLGRPGLRAWLLYEGARRRLVHRLEGPTHAEVSPRPDEVQRAQVGALGDRFLSLDPFVLLRPDTLEEFRALLGRVDALFLSEDEMELGGAEALPVLAGWLLGEPHQRAVERGIVSASFALEEWGPAGILRATPEAAEARLREWFR